MKKQIKINELIFEKIKFRYHFLTEQRMFQRNIRNKVLLDSFYPAWIAKKIIRDNDDARSITVGKGYAISERIARDLNSKILHISELITMLGYTKTDISKIIQAAKNKEISLTLVGLGGTGSNALHWMYEMSQWTGKEEIFASINLIDDDDFDIPNMLRIPFIPQFSGNEASAKKAKTIPSRFKLITKQMNIYDERLTENFLSVRGNTPLGALNRSIIYGAPDIQTREFLTTLNYTFLAATHRDNEYSIVENPSVDNDLMMETYGKINLSMFFLNHLSMTIEFLKHIGERTEAYGEEGRLNQTIVRHNFADRFSVEIANGFKAGSKKLFPANEDITTVTIELPRETA